MPQTLVGLGSNDSVSMCERSLSCGGRCELSLYLYVNPIGIIWLEKNSLSIEKESQKNNISLKIRILGPICFYFEYD